MNREQQERLMEKIEYGFLDNNGNNICDNVDLEYTFNKVY